MKTPFFPIPFALLFFLAFACEQEQSAQSSNDTLPENPITIPGQAGTPKLIWADEFDTEGFPDPEKWVYDTGGHGFGNNELQFYTEQRAKNVRVENGLLIIEAHKERFEERNYTSGKIWNKGRHAWRYGRYEIKAKLPSGRGTWPAIWMLPELPNFQWPRDGEIDIMEHVGFNQDYIHGTIHTEKYNHNINTQKGKDIFVPGVSEEFHVYALEWTRGKMEWFVDDNKYYTLTEVGGDGYEGWPFDTNDYFLILNLAIGGNWGGQQGVDDDIFPQRLEIDYVRVYAFE